MATAAETVGRLTVGEESAALAASLRRLTRVATWVAAAGAPARIIFYLHVLHWAGYWALRVTFGHEDEGSHKLRLNFVDADGRFIMPGIDLPAEVVLPGDSHFGTRNFIVTFQQLKFDLPGLYSIDVSLDGKPQASIPLLVKHTPTPPTPPA